MRCRSIPGIKRALLGGVLALATAATGCGALESNGGAAASRGKADAVGAGLSTFRSAGELASYLRQKRQALPEQDPMSDAVIAEAGGMGGGGGGGETPSITALQEQERQAVMRTCGIRPLLEDVPVRFGGFVDHPDSRVADRDLLEHHRIARRFLERETEGRERLVELAGTQEIEAFPVVVDLLGLLAAQDLLPERHAQGV